MKKYYFVLLFLVGFITQAEAKFIKIANNGSVIADNVKLGSGDQNWACTKDDVTGLIWEVKTGDDTGDITELRDKKSYYTWYDGKTGTANGGRLGSSLCLDSACDTYSYTNAVNTQKLCGANDWRMPTKSELSILFKSISTSYFNDGAATDNHIYWSSDNTTADATYGILESSVFGASPKSQAYSVRLVRKDTATTPPVTTLVPSVSSINASPSTVTQNKSITFSAILSSALPKGYTVYLKYGKTSVLMSGSGANYSVVQKLSTLGLQTFTIAIYDAKNVVKSNILTGTFEVIKPNAIPTIKLISNDSKVTSGVLYTVKLSATDSDGNLKNVVFNWGDGTSDTQNAKNGITLIFTHLYSIANTYTWSAQAYDTSAASSKAISTKITVSKAAVTSNDSTTTSSTNSTTSTTVLTGYTKIANDGSILTDSATLGTGSKDWACTKDNKTGLIWEVKTTDGGLRDKKWSYSWYETDANKNNGYIGKQNNGTCNGSDCDTYGYRSEVNNEGLCGSKNWRLPTRDELNGLIYCSDSKYSSLNEQDLNSLGYGFICTSNNNWKLNTSTWTINSTYFPNTQQNYWFSYTKPYNLKTTSAWVVDFYWGSNDAGNVNTSYNVRLVTGGNTATGYTKIANDGSILTDSATLGTGSKDWACTKDNKTGLIWEVKTTDGGLRDLNKNYTNFFVGDKGYGATSNNTDVFVSAVNKQKLCSAANWRLPTLDELKGLLTTTSTANPLLNDSVFIDINYFPNTKSLYWSSTPYSDYGSAAWNVDFYYGRSSYYNKVLGNFVRLVH